MNNKVFLLAPDKFKFSMTATEFCEIAESCIKRVFPDATVISCPLADGGEGSLDCFAANTGAKIVSGTYKNANFTPISANFALFNDIAFIECLQQRDSLILWIKILVKQQLTALASK